MQPLNRRKFVVLTGGAFSISGCLNETSVDRGDTDEHVDDDPTSGEEEVDDEDVIHDVERSFEVGDLPDDGVTWLDLENRFLTCFDSPISPAYEVKFLETPSETSPAVVRVALDSGELRDPELVEGRYIEVRKDGPVYYYGGRKISETGEATGRPSNYLPTTDEEPYLYLTPADRGHGEYSDDCWRLKQTPEPEETVEVDIDETEVIWQDYHLLSTEECLPTGIYGFPGQTGGENPVFVTVGEKRKRPDPTESRFYDTDVPETHIWEWKTGETERTLYHGTDEDTLAFIEPSKEMLELPEDTLEFTLYNYTRRWAQTHESWDWTIEKLTDDGWSGEPAASAPEGEPTFHVLPGQHHTVEITLEPELRVGGDPAGGGEQLTNNQEILEPGIYVFSYTELPTAFAFEVED